MNLLVSIFGGMILTAVLYGVGRAGRLSNFWAAVIAAALPSVLYTLYAVKNWAGLDVFTMHIVAYPTVSVLLGQLYGAKADHSKSLHWAPKVMILFFTALSFVLGSLVYISSNGLPPRIAAMVLPNIEGKVVHTGFAGVVEHDMGAAKEIGHRLKMVHRLETLGWSLQVDGIGSLKADHTHPITLKISDKNGNGVDGVVAEIVLARPGAVTGQIRLPMSGSGSGNYQSLAPALEQGTWVVTVVMRHAGKDISLDHTVDVRR